MCWETWPYRCITKVWRTIPYPYITASDATLPLHDLIILYETLPRFTEALVKFTTHNHARTLSCEALPCHTFAICDNAVPSPDSARPLLVIVKLCLGYTWLNLDITAHNNTVPNHHIKGLYSASPSQDKTLHHLTCTIAAHWFTKRYPCVIIRGSTSPLP